MDFSIISSVMRGTRIQPVSVAVELGLERTVETVKPSAYEPKSFIKPALQIGERYTYYPSYQASVSIGTLASSVSLSDLAFYPKIDVMPLAKRIGFDGANAIFSNLELAREVTKTYTGISTHGIGYVPPSSSTDNNAELRRWPRNWYGDNIKN